MPATTNHTSVDKLNAANVGKLPGWLGLEVTAVAPGRIEGRLPVRADLVAHTGYLLAGAVLSVADILCAYGVSSAWPEGASGFTTAEVKCNFTGTCREGAVLCTAELLHGGRTTQVWDATMTARPLVAWSPPSAARRSSFILGPPSAALPPAPYQDPR